MAILTPGRSSQRPARLTGLAQLYARGGQLLAQSWPRKRGKSKLPWQRANVVRFQIAAQQVKYVSPVEQVTMHDALQEFLDENKGLRGTAAIRLRDWMTQVLFGRAWAIRTEEFGIIYPATMVQDVSDLLDLLDPWLGSLLTRTDETWLPTVQCKEGFIIMEMTDHKDPVCCPVASVPPRDQSVGGY